MHVVNGIATAATDTDHLDDAVLRDAFQWQCNQIIFHNYSLSINKSNVVSFIFSKNPGLRTSWFLWLSR